MRAPAHHRYTWKQYLSIDADSEMKLEFLDGEIFAMSGGSPEHAALGAAVSSELVGQLRGGPCRAFSPDLKIRSVATGLCTYPDASVVCGELIRDRDDKNV